MGGISQPGTSATVNIPAKIVTTATYQLLATDFGTKVSFTNVLGCVITLLDPASANTPTNFHCWLQNSTGATCTVNRKLADTIFGPGNATAGTTSVDMTSPNSGYHIETNGVNWYAISGISSANGSGGTFAYTTTATAAGTTTLTSASTFIQRFTGTLAQTVVLPVTSTLSLGQQFLIINDSTGTLTIQSSGANTVTTPVGGASTTLTCVNLAVTTAAGWSTTITVGGSLTTNTAIGNGALYSNTTAALNTAVGYQALYSSTTAPQNTAVGYRAGYSTTTGAENTALGQEASFSSTTGDKITAIGRGAMRSTTTGDGTAIGANVLYLQTTGLANVAVGGGSTSNVAALFSVTTGNANVGVGVGSGTGLTTGGNNVYLGGFTNASASGVSSEVVVGYNCTGKGASTGFISPSGGGVYQGNNSLSWSVTSDQRLKKNIVDNNVGLEKITAIQVRNFEYRLPEEVDAELKLTDAIQKEGVQLGVIAQELQLVLPECVNTESTGVMSVNADNLTWYLVNAIKELNAKFEAYKSTHP